MFATLIEPLEIGGEDEEYEAGTASDMSFGEHYSSSHMLSESEEDVDSDTEVSEAIEHDQSDEQEIAPAVPVSASCSRICCVGSEAYQPNDISLLKKTEMVPASTFEGDTW